MSKPGYYGPYGYGIINDKTGKFVKLSDPSGPGVPQFIKQGARDLGTGAMSTLGKIGGGISAAAKNPYVSAVSDAVFKYGIDPLAELAVRAGSADVLPNITDPSKPNTNLLKMLTTETGPQDYDSFMGVGGTQPAFENKYIDKGDGTFEIKKVPVMEDGAQALEYKQGLIPTAKRITKIPGMLGDMAFGDARKMGEFLEAEDTFFSRRISDNPDKAQRLGARFFLADIFPATTLNKLFRGSFEATEQLNNAKKAIKQQAEQQAKEAALQGSAGAASPIELLNQQVRNYLGEITDDQMPYLVGVVPKLPKESREKLLNTFSKKEMERYNLFNFAKEYNESHSAKLFQRSIRSHKAREPNYDALLNQAVEEGIVKKRNLSPGKKIAFTPEGVDFLKNNYAKMTNEDLKSLMTSDKDALSKYFYTDTKGNPVIPGDRTFKDYPTQTLKLKKDKEIDKRGSAKTESSEAVRKNISDRFNEILIENKINPSNLEEVRNAFAQAFKEKDTLSGGGSRALSDRINQYNAALNFGEFDKTIIQPGRVYNQFQIEQINKFKKFGDAGSDDSNAFKTFLTSNKDYQNIKKSIPNDKFVNDLGNEVSLNKAETVKRYIDFVRKSDPANKKPVQGDYSNFMNNNKLQLDDLKNKDSTEFNNYKKFAFTDNVRFEVGELVKDFLNKRYPAEGNKKAKNSVQIAHAFEGSQIGKTLPEGLSSSGMIPQSYYLDISQLNALDQPIYESAARSAINKGDINAIQDISTELEKIGAQVTIDGYTLGRHKPLEEKLIELIGGPPGSLERKELKRKYGINDSDISKMEQAIELLSKGAKRINVDFLKDGGYVGDMIPVNANVGGFFSKLFGTPPAFRKEGMDVSNVYGPTKAQQQTLEQLYPGQAFPDYVPGEVFYSNLDLSLSKRDAPLIFNTNKEFRDYMNQSGVGVDELNDAKVLNFVNSKFKEGQPVLAKDLLDISSQSPVRNVYIDGYGFRSDKVNKAPKTELDYTGSVRVKEGDPVQKSANYPSQGLLDGFDDGTYKERVLRINKGNLRGDTGSVPGGTAHSFGNEYDDGANNYVIAWTRQTDRSGKIIPGQTIDRETGDLVTAGQLADQTRLGELEKRINRLFEDPITSLNPDDMAGVTSAVNRLVEKNPNLTQSRAFNIVNQQITSKQKELKKLQNQYNEEAARIKGFKPEAEQEVKLTVIDELQSDVMQSMNRKARELAARLEVMAEDGIPLTQMRDKELLEYFQATGDIRRPVGKTKTELMNQYNELMNMQKQLTALSRQPAYAITPANINLYRDTIKGRQAELIDQMSEEISNDLMRSLFPDLPFKDRVQYADALSKQAIAESAYRLFVEKDPNAPRFIGFMSGEVVAGDAYSQTGRTSTSIAERKRDKLNRIDAFKTEIRGGNESAKIAPSGLPGVGTDEFYGGPLSKSRVGDGVEVDEIGGHYTSTMESVFKKIANQYGSELKIINVAASKPRRVDSYDIINQETKQVVGSGDTYRQAENIANDLVDSEGGRYTIDRSPKLQYDTRPIFGMEITPQMLQLFKAYK